MMEALDKGKKGLGILSYGISVTTLEEVFLKVGAATKEILDEDEEEKEKPRVDDQKSRRTYEKDGKEVCSL